MCQVLRAIAGVDKFDQYIAETYFSVWLDFPAVDTAKTMWQMHFWEHLKQLLFGVGQSSDESPT